MGAHTTAKERQELVARFRRSGLTQREFCEMEDISLGALRSWLYKRNRARVEVPRFVEVTSPRSQVEATTIELHLDALRVVLPTTLDDGRLVDLVVALNRRMGSSK